MYLMSPHPDGTFLIVNTVKGLIDYKLNWNQACGVMAVFRSDYYDRYIAYDEALEVLWNHYSKKEYGHILKKLGEVNES